MGPLADDEEGNLSLDHKPIVRTWRLLKHLESRAEGYTTRELAEIASVPLRTIYRDMERLVEAGFSVRKSGRNRWRILTADEGGLSIPATASEVLVLDAVVQGLPEGSLVRATLDGMVRRLRAVLTPSGLRMLQRMKAALTVGPLWPAAPPLDPAVPAQIAASLANRRSLQILYQSRPEAKAAWRTVDPYLALERDGVTYLAAYCHQRGEVRIFRVGRIRKLKETGRPFEMAPSFDPEAFRGSMFRIFQGTLWDIRLRFDREVALFVSERVWHPSQRLEWRSDGQLELTMEAMGLREVAWWLAGYGGHVSVMSPPELRLELIHIHRQGLLRHEAASSGD